MAVYYSNTSNGYRLRLEATIKSQDIPLNRTEIEYLLYLENGNQRFEYTTNAYFDLDGTRVYNHGGGAMNLPYFNYSYLLASGTRYVTHDADGSKSLPLYAYLMTTGVASFTPQTALVINTSMALTTIPRASSIKTFGNFLIDAGTITATVERAVTNFTHTFYLQVLNASNKWETIKTVSNVATTANMALTEAQQNIIYNAIPDALSRKVRLVVYTYSGSNHIGTTIKEAVASVPTSIKPTIEDLLFYDAVAVSRGLGAFIQRVSRIRTTISNAAGAKGSTIKTYEITQNGETTQASQATMSQPVSASGNVPITGKVIDSRNRAGTLTKNAPVLAYAFPSITLIDITRCNADGSLNVIGTHARVRVRGRWTSLKVGNVEKNSGTLRLMTKLETSSTYTLRETRTVSASFDETFILSGHQIEYVYDVRAEITDAITTRNFYSQIKTGRAPFVIGDDGIGAGMVPTGSHHIEAGIKGIRSDGPVDIFNTLKVMGSPVITEANNSLLLSGKLHWTGTTVPENVIKNKWDTLPMTIETADIYLIRTSGTNLALAVVVKTSTVGVVLLVKAGQSIRMDYDGSTWS